MTQDDKDTARILPTPNQDDVEQLKEAPEPSRSRTEAPLKPDFQNNPSDEDSFEEDDEGNLSPIEE